MRAFFTRKKRASIRTRVLAIVLIPSAALLITGGTVAGLLVHNGVVARNFSDYLGNLVDLAERFGNVVQAERATSLRAVGGDQQAAAELADRRAETDTVLETVAGTTATAADSNPTGVDEANSALAELGARLPVIRQSIDSRQAAATDVDGYFTQLSNFVVIGLEGVARSSPDPRAAMEETVSTDLYLVSDAHSRAVGLAAGAAEGGALTQADRLTQAQLTGAYRNQLTTSVSRLTESGRARYEALIASPEWRLATTAEDNLAQRGTPGVPMTDWLAAEQHVSTELLGLWGDHYRYAESLAKDAASTSLLQSVLAGAGVLVLAVGAFAVAARLASALVRRLRGLRTTILGIAEEKLPSIVRRLNSGEHVDLNTEMSIVDEGDDEIGQVADAFNTAQRTAVDAAAAEAKTRGGINRVFLDIAHRSQLVVHRQLEVLDVAEAKQSDPEHLELLFKLDHLATRARRNAESLVILGGGQPGRKWRNPVVLEDIVRSAVSETEEFARVSSVRLPEVRVQGAVVADLLHLLAELVDNATAFSPPDAPVTVRGNVVGKGVVVEVEDQGLGIEFEQRERLNETLRNPPAFQEMALAGKRNLGVFVIGQLARRHGISVSLVESAYGGIKAIVLIPTTVIESSEAAQPDEQPGAEPNIGRHRQRRSFLPETARDRVPRLPDREVTVDEWPTEEPSPASGKPPAPAAPRPSGRTKAPLPRRSKQQHLVPQLQFDDTAQEDAGHDGARRSPDEARSSMSAFQRGTRQARNR
ncbi:sensor histidine kinase [Prauserella cavernicola]|uniref:Nitrate- and nitrite sensing domain-containing protein n=1 Tax=Prauserella cavernicola TaxID=2800127 RepID=A0A934QXI7_9PSEU|nr:nitrate- and nitrite sensing domain-containing protein [Prauserella cavernicola]MBK1787103.1 nitrate- and nitrite sensing domain-containing protein [Prauserella cavernicola]